MGGFESACMSFAWTHAFEDGYEADVHGLGGHLERAEEAYRLLASIGVLTVRDALSWKRIETAPGRYDWSSFLTLIEAARKAGVQVVWDLCHFGLPPHVDPFAPDFADRFGSFAHDAATVLRTQGGRAPVWCPINEISYWSYAGGEAAHFAPHGRGRGHELKLAFCAATIRAIAAVRGVDAAARILLIDPMMHTVGAEGATAESELERGLQFDAWDIVAGRKHPELGGSPDHLDLMGVNYYATSQWFADERTPIPRGHPHHRRPGELILEVAQRYSRPLVVSETGAEGAEGPPWLDYMLDEVAWAQAQGADVQGVCLYPVMDYPGWTDERHCPCGLIEVAPGWGQRTLRDEMVGVLARPRTSDGASRPSARQAPPVDRRRHDRRRVERQHDPLPTTALTSAPPSLDAVNAR